MNRLYRKRPIVVEALQLTRETWSEMCDFAGVGRLVDGKPEGYFLNAEGHRVSDGETGRLSCLLIPTLEGLMVAELRDWIIRGVKGELYPCKPDILEATYEEAK